MPTKVKRVPANERKKRLLAAVKDHKKQGLTQTLRTIVAHLDREEQGKRQILDMALRNWLDHQSEYNAQVLYRAGLEYFGIKPHLHD